MPAGLTRNDWTRAEIADLFDLPFTDLAFRAAENTAPLATRRAVQ